MENENANSIDLVELFFLLMNNIGKIIIAGILTAAIAFGYTKAFVVPMYQSTAKMVIKVISSETFTTYSDIQIAVGLVNDCIEIINSRQIMQKVIDNLGLDYTPEQLSSCVKISSPADTRVLKLSVVNPDPKLAKDIAEEICSLSEGTVAANVGVESINTFEKPSMPLAPISPNVAKNTCMGGFAGMFIVAAYVIAVKLLNNKIYTSEDVEKELGLTVFTSIPYIELQNENRDAASAEDSSKVKEAHSNV